MKQFLQGLGQQIKSTVWRAWRRLLKSSKSPVLLAPKSLRKKYCGRIGLKTSYIIHASPSPKPEESIGEQVVKLLNESEQRFFAGQFFEPFAEQVDRKSAIIISRMRQGDEDQPVDHLITIFPSHD